MESLAIAIRLEKFLNTIISKMQTGFLSFKAYVIQSGFLSDPINIEHDFQQGDPIAPNLFIICAQILCLMVIHNRKVFQLIMQK